MAKEPEFTGFASPEHAFETMNGALERATKKPAVGVTQGGSSRKWRGAKPAAKDPNIYRGRGS